VETTSGLTLNTFVHVIVTHDGTGTAAGVKIYLDGVSQSLTTNSDTLTLSTTTGTSKFLVIGASTEGTVKFTGQLDDTIIFNFELTPSEAAILSQAEHGLH